jgi:hypothetical protein
MPAPSGSTAYTFDGTAFYRLVTGEFTPWFAGKVEHTQDLVLDSNQDYLDLGATAYEQLQLRAVVFSLAARQVLEAKLGTTAVLSNAKTYSQDTTLVAVTPVDLGVSGYFAVDLTFIRRPTGSV